VDMDSDTRVNKAFMVWFTDRVIDARNLVGFAKEDEHNADAIAAELMAAAGYDPKELEKLIEKIPSGGGAFAHHPSNADRIDALKKRRAEPVFGADGGKAPAFPSNVKWPAKPAS
jgi:beta-barrel assembly-enhancing protease